MGRILYDEAWSIASVLPDSHAAQNYNFANFPSGPEYGLYVPYVLTLADRSKFKNAAILSRLLLKF